MGKFENIPELRGTENYYEWRRQTEQLLLGEGVYNHVSQGTNPFHYIDYASTMPRPFNPSAPTLEERALIEAWLKDDGKAKSIVMRKLNSTVLTLIPDDINITARDIWVTLANYYDRADISLQFSLKAKIAEFQMKGAADAEKYVAAHVHANEQLARMGAKPSETEAIYALLRGLPKSGLWPMIRKGIETEVERNNAAVRQAQQASLFPCFPPQQPQFPQATHLSMSSDGSFPPNPFRTPQGSPARSNNPFLLRPAMFTPADPDPAASVFPTFTPPLASYCTRLAR